MFSTIYHKIRLFIGLVVCVLFGQYAQAQCVTPPRLLYPGESYTLTTQAGLTNIQWYRNTGSGAVAISGATSTSLVVTTEGTYTYTGTDASGCAIELCCPINIKACLPATYLMYPGESYTLTAEAGLTNIQWYRNTGSGPTLISGATGAALTVTTEGVYTYTALNASGCSADLCCPITIKACTNTPYYLCSGGSFTLTAQAGLTNIQWYRNTGSGAVAISGATSANLTVTQTGLYTYTGRDASGCTTELCCPINVVASTPLSITSQPTAIVECINGTQTLSVTAEAGAEALTYQWQSSTNNSTFTNISGATNASYTPPSTVAGTVYYRVVVTSAVSSCSVTSSSVSVQVTPAPVVTVTSALSVVCAGQSTTLNANVTDATGSCSVQWEQSTNGGGSWTNTGATGTSFTTPVMTADTRFRAKLACSASGCCN